MEAATRMNVVVGISIINIIFTNVRIIITTTCHHLVVVYDYFNHNHPNPRLT